VGGEGPQAGIMLNHTAPTSCSVLRRPWNHVHSRLAGARTVEVRLHPLCRIEKDVLAGSSARQPEIRENLLVETKVMGVEEALQRAPCPFGEKYGEKSG